jgi:RimJ/RimL family protein N-acetyltransferase
MSDAVAGSVQTAEAPPVTPISLTGPSVRLRPVTHEDYGFLWECRCHPEIMHLWMQGRAIPSFEQYVRELETAFSGTILTLFMIETHPSGRTVGFVFAYDYVSYDRVASWTIALHPAYANLGWGWEAGFLFWEYLFTYFDLRKLYADVYAFNRHSLQVLLRTGAHEEGRFLAHRYYRGEYHDVIRVATTRAEFESTQRRAKAIFARRAARAAAAARVAASGEDGARGSGERAAMAELTETPELAVAAQQNGHDGRRRSGGGRREAL